MNVNPSLQAVKAEQLLGVKLRYEDYTEAHLNHICVQEVIKDSPAMEAGLLEYKDYIFGTPQLKSFESLEQFAKLLQVNADAE